MAKTDFNMDGDGSVVIRLDFPEHSPCSCVALAMDGADEALKDKIASTIVTDGCDGICLCVCLCCRSNTYCICLLLFQKSTSTC